VLATNGVVGFVAADATGVYATVDTSASAGPAYVMKLDPPS
jgi:hypothetical protein